MRPVIRLFSNLIFLLVFFVFLLLSAVNFQLLNQNYLFGIFESGGLYRNLPVLLSASLPNDPNLSAEERGGYATIVGNIPAADFKEITETNLGNFLDFVWGKTDTVTVSVAAKRMGLGKTDISWSPKPDLQKKLAGFMGIGQKIFAVWLVSFAVLIVAYLLLRPSGMFLILYGIFLTFSGLVIEGVAYLLPRTFPAQLEPAQALLKLVFTSVVPQIVLVWIIVGILIIGIGFVRRGKRT